MRTDVVATSKWNPFDRIADMLAINDEEKLGEHFSNTEMTAALRSAADASTQRADMAEFAANRLRDCTWID